MLITSKGQVTIPAWIREEKGFLPHTEVEFEMDEDGVRLVKAKSQCRGAGVLEQLKGSASSGMSTDEIMALTRGNE